MKQYRYTSKDFMGSDADDEDAALHEDALLPEDDPIHEFKRTGDTSVFNRPGQLPLAKQAENHLNKIAIAKEQGITPGSPAWHLL